MMKDLSFIMLSSMSSGDTFVLKEIILILLRSVFSSEMVIFGPGLNYKKCCFLCVSVARSVQKILF